MSTKNTTPLLAACSLLAFSCRSVPDERHAIESEAEPRVIVEDFETALARARAEGKLVLANFSGRTCVNCRRMEAQVFAEAEVERALAGFVEARMYVDEPGAEASQELMQALTSGRAVPAYVVIDPDSEESLGMQLGASGEDEFVRFLAPFRR
ncbi:MAG: hypothetical protein GY711_04585 [bacterium]|nr:hypothetical protein [bacterium]